LGEQKFNVEKLKYHATNLKILDYIEQAKEAIKIKEKLEKIAEDEEFEYYLDDEDVENK